MDKFSQSIKTILNESGYEGDPKNKWHVGTGIKATSGVVDKPYVEQVRERDRQLSAAHDLHDKAISHHESMAEAHENKYTRTDGQTHKEVAALHANAADAHREAKRNLSISHIGYKGYQTNYDRSAERAATASQKAESASKKLSPINEAVKKIGEYTSSCGTKTSKVYKLSGEHDEGDPYTVKLFKNGKHYEPAQYFTNDSDDAHSTAKHMIKEDLNESTDDEAPTAPVSLRMSKTDAKYRAQTFAKGRDIKGSYGNTYNPDDEEGKMVDSNPAPTSGVSVSSFNTGDKVKISSSFGKANFKNGVRHTAPHEVISTNSTHAHVKNLVKGTTHQIPLAHIIPVGKRGRPTLASTGGDKSSSKWDASAINGAPSWLGLGKPVPQKVAGRKVSFSKPEDHLDEEVVDLDESKISPEEAKNILTNHGGVGTNFHELSSSTVSSLLDHAKKYGYRKSPNAPGSTGRMFHQHLSRIVSRTVSESFASQGRAAERDWHSNMAGEVGARSTIPDGHTHELINKHGNRVATASTPEKLFQHLGKAGPGARIKKIMAEDFNIELSKEGNMYKYQVISEDAVLFEGFAVTISGAENMAVRYVNTIIAEAEEYSSQEVMAEEYRKDALEIAKKAGVKNG